MSNTILVRVKGLTEQEWRRFKAKAALEDRKVGELAADALRALLPKEGKP